ncbi:cuticle protein 19-like [Athalia rosae]|uniref:cuticle protein 19-like n=1 Tax=Athalia rosae TaxID=37344 RepID=UPI0020342629|nr:cuticle protein 19-like [Athalia rosae]
MESFKLATIFVAVFVGLLVRNVSSEGAHSYQHFHGPVEGHDRVVQYLDKHGHHRTDYLGHPKYSFAYGVEDHHTGDFHGQKEQRDGDEVVGEYSLKEPSGNVRTVKYHADKDGFHAVVHNTGGNDHSGAYAHGY